MAEIKSGDYLGYVDFGGGKTFDCVAISFEGVPGLHACQEVTETKNGITKKGYKVRSANFVKSTAASFRPNGKFTDAEITSALVASTEGDAGGYLPGASYKLPVGWSTENDGTPNVFIYKTDDINLDGISDGGGDSTGLTGTVRSAFNQVKDFVTGNPIAAVAILAGLAYLVHLYIYRNKKRKPKFLGLL